MAHWASRSMRPAELGQQSQRCDTRAGETVMSERAILIAALEKDDPAERAACLDQACADDRALRQRIERLLKAHEPADSFLEHRPPGLGVTVDVPPIAEGPGTVI